MKNGMSRWKRLALGLLLLLGAAGAKAEAPAHCSYGYQDSSCLGPQYRAAQTPPTCSTDVGWTTIAPAVWQGSKFSVPQCNYQAPPTCQAGYTQTSDPVWNGSSWSAPGCTPNSVPQLPGGEPTIISAAWSSAGIWCTANGTSDDGFSQLSEWWEWDTDGVVIFTDTNGNKYYFQGNLSAQGSRTLQQFYEFLKSIESEWYLFTLYNNGYLQVYMQPNGVGCYVT